jgi:membrane peptidoglycan carboxypeptidase
MRSKLPTLRSSLLRIHRSILVIADEIYLIDQSPRLTKLEKMVILLEDRRFLDHNGIDLKSVVRETAKAARFRRHGGASTIDIQLFRTASDRYERSIRRKLREMVGALVLQRKFTKLAILRIYLRIAYFGTGLKGSLDAAKAMFPDNFDEYEWDLDDNKLGLDQSAQIAALLVYPKPRVPNANWQAKVRRRANYGLALYARREKRLDKILR